MNQNQRENETNVTIILSLIFLIYFKILIKDDE